MAKTSTANATPATQSSDKKERKRLAKREAKVMLKVEQAKKDVQKAEQKVGKAHQTLEERSSYVHSLEEKLTRLRSPGHNGASEQEQEQHREQQMHLPLSTHQSNGIPTINDVPPIEGHRSIPQNADPAQAEATSQSSAPAADRQPLLVETSIAQQQEPVPPTSQEEGNGPQAQDAPRAEAAQADMHEGGAWWSSPAREESVQATEEEATHHLETDATEKEQS